ncbi:MAG: lipoate--protein ligase family protein [Deltaproteobacteria bacterium HGW-Deltaproteobacteria-1]|jgi:lipoate-protein ligase A|nr:MAG: lipoate--protein ligase family protein [Deltaproteobacteria bacterium HGW-Deltaproteobacteria-1]
MIWRFLNYRSCSAAENMAIDEAVLLETIHHDKPPTLRFYGWSRPAVSIGYFQELKKEINYDLCLLSDVKVVRRITGGKAVYHRDEITYSIVAGSSTGLFPNDIAGTYKIISLCLLRGLSNLGIHAKLAEASSIGACKEPDLNTCCFSVPAGNELMVAGRKICGSAQTRIRGGFIQHGSMLMTFDPAETAAMILSSDVPEHYVKLRRSVTAVNELLPASVSVETLCSALKKGFVDELRIDMTEGTLTPAEKALSRQLVKKYESDAWNRERKKKRISQIHS